MRLIFHGELKHLYGDSFDMKADTVADAIEGFSRQAPNWPRDLRIVVPGFRSEEKLHTFAEEVHLMPSLSGGGGKWGSIILGAALVVVGILLLPNPIGWSLIVSGGLMMAQGVIQLFLKSPKIKGTSDPEASKYFGVNRNTTEVGTLMTLAWGTIDIYPHWLSLQSDSNNLAYGYFPTTP